MKNYLCIIMTAVMLSACQKEPTVEDNIQKWVQESENLSKTKVDLDEYEDQLSSKYGFSFHLLIDRIENGYDQKREEDLENVLKSLYTSSDTTTTETIEKPVEVVKDYTYYTSNYITDDEISNLSDDEVYYLMYEFYAREGCDFWQDDLVAYFSTKSWYTPYLGVYSEDFDRNQFTPIEQYNVTKLYGTMLVREQGPEEWE